jgi:cytochrome c-type biogenesis protein CcmH
MIAFWIATALAAAAASLLVIAIARRPGPAVEGSPEAALYARHLAEVDELHARGLLGTDEHRAARAEAGRRLLAAADAHGAVRAGTGRGGRAVLLAAVVGAPVLALALYLATGRPGTADQPYAERLETWRASDPLRLPIGALAAVAEQVTEERPSDPNPWRALGRARLAAGESFAAVQALERAAQLGNTADDWAALGEAVASQNGGAVNETAANAFAEALKRDPASVPARYGLAQAAITRGDLAEARERLEALAASLPTEDPRRAALQAEVAQLAGASASAPAQGGGVQPALP